MSDRRRPARLLSEMLLTLAVVGLGACGGSGAVPVPPDPDPLEGEVRVSRGTAGAHESWAPEICCSGRYTYVVWADDRNGLPDIYFSASEDGGRTWLAEDRRLDTDLPGAADSLRPVLCCSGLDVFVAWEDYRNGQADVYLNRSSDGGLTWELDDVRLDTDLAGFSTSTQPEICCDGPRIYVVWSDARTAGLDIHLNASADGGETWLQEDVRVDTDLPGDADSTRPQVCCSGTSAYVTWEDDRSGALDVYFNRSIDGGETWEASDRRLDTATPNLGDSLRPRICCDGALVHVTWQDTRSGLADVRFNASRDRGASWFANDVRVDTDPLGDAVSAFPEICCVGLTVHVVWQDDRRGDDDVRYSRSDDGGSTWLLDDVRLDTDPFDASNARRPQLACDGAYVYATWEDDRSGVRAIRLNLSQDAGLTWRSGDLRVDRSPAGVTFTSDPRVCSAGSRVVVTWRDLRAGAGDIYANGGEVR